MKFSKSAVIFLFSATSLSAVPAFADAAPATDETVEEIVVTGTRLAVPLDQIGQSVSVITAADIQARQQAQVFDALQLVPGIQTQRSGPIGTTSTVFVRGAPSQQTLVVQDGIVLNSLAATSGGFNFANFDTSDVERIEVIRGAQSTIYGSDAIGGVINIITKTGRDGFGGSASLEAGSFGTVRGQGTVYGGDSKLYGRATVSAQRSDGFSAQSGNTEDDGFENLTISGRVGYEPTENLKLEAVARYSDSTLEFDGFPTEFAISDTEEWNAAAFATHTSLDGRLVNRVGITYSWLKSNNLNDEAGDEGDGIPSELTFLQEGERISYEYQGAFEANNWLDVVAGFEYEEAEADVPVAFVSFAEQIDQTSGYGLVRIKPTSWLNLTGGIRHDSSDRFGDATTANATANITLDSTGTIIRGSYSEGFKAPTPGQLGANAAALEEILALGRSPELNPEQSTSWDIGVQQALPLGGATLSLTYFQNDISNLIAFEFLFPAFVSSFFNIDSVSIEGVEVELAASPLDGLDILASYTYLEAVDDATGVQLDNRPEHRATLDVQYAATSDFNIGAQLIYNGAETESFGDPLDDFAIVNLRADYQVTDKIQLFGRIDNLFDADYVDNFGFNTAPLSAYVGVRTSF